MPGTPLSTDWISTLITYMQDATWPTLALIAIWFAIFRLWPWFTDQYWPQRKQFRELQIQRDVLQSDAQSQLAQAVQRIHETMAARMRETGQLSETMGKADQLLASGAQNIEEKN